MYKLLLDTSNKLLVIALANEEKVIDKIIYDAWQLQSEYLVPEIDNILSRNKVTKEDIDSIVVGIGPGSYTGVRIAITVAKTMAYVLKAKVYAVSSMSLFQIPGVPTICVTNARSGRSYFAVYHDGEPIVKDVILENTQVLSYIDEHKDFALSGETTHLGLEAREFDPAENLFSMMDEKHLIDDVFKLNPIYLKDLYL